MATFNQCPTCGAPIPEGTPDGVCPRCALNGALRSSSRDLAEGTPHAPELNIAKHALEVALGAASSEAPGARIGPFKLLQKIGEGGFGVVWMAEQEQPIRRRVALKILRSGMDTREVTARFEAERQALALMDHPNIARVFDAGSTESGLPYFVMELVRGIPITRYCDDNKLTTEARLRLFIAVCHGVQHAHHKGVVHRDLKPSNILVTLHDGEPVPKIIDFGIAKATSGARLTDKTLFTQFHAFVGTPAYTSPEQIEMSGLDVDTRSDIYSLGVLLYELLAGRPPFDADALAKSGLDAMRRTIREVDPPRPSQRLDTLSDAERTTVARERRTDVAKLESLLHGDLDAIAMHCLEKDRTRRYETANALASDIERHLRHEPIVARPPSRIYRAGKFVRRHRVGVAAAAAVVLSLCAGLIASSILLARERSAHRRAVASERAETTLRREAESAREAETIRASRTARDLAERLFVEGRSADGLAWLVHAARKNPRDTTIAPRLASLLTSRNFFLPAGPPLQLPSRVVHVHTIDEGQKAAVYCEDGTVSFLDFASGGQTTVRLPAGLKTPGVLITGEVTVVRGSDDVVRVLDPTSGRIEREFKFGQAIALITAKNQRAPVVFAVLEDRSVVIAEALTGRTRVMPFRHPEGTGSLLSPDGRWVARGASASEGELWETATGELCARARVSGTTRAVFFSPDSSRLLVVYQIDAACSAFLLVSVPDLKPLTAPGELNEREYNANAFIVAGFSADGRWISIASQMGQQIFETATGTRVGPFVKTGVHGMPFTSDREAASAAPGIGTSRIFFPPPIFCLQDRWCYVTASPLDAPVALTVRDVPTGEALYPPLTHAGSVGLGCLTEDGESLVGVGMDRTLILWDLRTGRRLAEPTLLGPDVDCSPAISPDGRELVIGRADGSVQRMRAGREPARALVLPRRESATVPPVTAPFLPDGPTRLLWLETRRAVVVDVAAGKTSAGGFSYPEEIRGMTIGIGGIAARPDLKFMVLQTAAGHWQAWELEPGRIKRIVSLEEAPEGTARIFFSPRDDLVALIPPAHPESPRIWKLTTGKPVGAALTQETAVPTGNVIVASFSPDGRLFACGTRNGTVTISEVGTGRCLAKISPPRLTPVGHLEFSPDGKCVQASYMSGVVRLWEAPSGRLLVEIPRATAAIFSPAGDRLLAGQGDTGRVCDRETGKDVSEPISHPGVGIRAAAFSPDGRRVVTAAQDSTARIWDAATGLPLSEPLWHSSRVAACEFSPDGRFVRTEDADGQFDFWAVPPDPGDVPAPEWLLQLATICARRKINDAGQCVDAPEAVAQFENVRRTLATLPDDAPFVEWGRWILDDRPDRSIAPGFTITPAEAKALESRFPGGTSADEGKDPS